MNEQELVIRANFQEALLRLSAPEPKEAVPIGPEDIKVDLVRQALEEVGFDLEPRAAVIESLRERQFRNFDSGRGPGMEAVLGRPRLAKLMMWASTKAYARPAPRLSRGSNSWERGLRQMAADIVLLAIADPTPEAVEEFCRRTNLRVAKGLRHTHKSSGEILVIDQKFGPRPSKDNSPEDKAYRRASSVPPGSPVQLWQLLIGEGLS